MGDRVVVLIFWYFPPLMSQVNSDKIVNMQCKKCNDNAHAKKVIENFTIYLWTQWSIKLFATVWNLPDCEILAQITLLFPNYLIKITVWEVQMNYSWHWTCMYHPIPQGFSSSLSKPYIKAVTQFCEVEW